MYKLSRIWLTTLAIIVSMSVIIAAIARPGATLLRRTDALGIAQMWVPADCFPISDPQPPAYPVCNTQGYWIDQFDVTNADFDAFVQSGGYRTIAYWSPDGLNWKQSNNITGPASRDDVGNDCNLVSSQSQQPRVCVNWYEAQAYANWRTQANHDGILYRLPTEAEWEYAAYGPLHWIYPWGNTFHSSKANTSEAGPSQTTAVGRYSTGGSWVGAQDMAGNVWQWTANWYDPDEFTYHQFRALRGGSWLLGESSARSTSRNWYAPAARNSQFGFRLVGIISPE